MKLCIDNRSSLFKNHFQNKFLQCVIVNRQLSTCPRNNAIQYLITPVRIYSVITTGWLYIICQHNIDLSKKCNKKCSKKCKPSRRMFLREFKSRLIQTSSKFKQVFGLIICKYNIICY